MKNTLENKAKFFAQYWGQNVLTRPKSDNKKWILGEEVSIHSALSKSGYDYQYFLELKPLSSITDEDALIVYRFHYPIDKWDTKERRDLFDTIEANDWLKNHYNEAGYINLTAEGSDYLRSKGYAIDWNGLKVEEIESFGWIKIVD